MARMSSPSTGLTVSSIDLRHRTESPLGPDHPCRTVDERDHRQVVAQPGAELQHRIDRLVDVMWVERDVEIWKSESSSSRAVSRSRVRSEIRRSRVAYERANSSVIRLNAVLKAPISSDDVTSLRT